MSQKVLLSVIEFLGYPNMRPLYERLGYKVATEFSVRKAIALMRKTPPDVVVADFFSDSDFRDRVSNLESLLAAAQKQAGCKTLVFYVPGHQDALDKVRQRFRIDAALTLPVKEAELEAVLKAWV
jgi:CheY-like chemotaxis protein